MIIDCEIPVEAQTINDDSQWYALRTHSRHEKQVRDRLEAIGIEPLLPLTRSLRQWTDRKVWTVMPLFSGYCFARFALGNRRAIIQTPGVAGIVGCAHPEAVPDDEIEALRKICISQRHAEPADYFVEGAWVEVVRGPLAGIRGQMIRKANHDCLVIRAHLIQQAASIHIEMSEVTLLDTTSPSFCSA
jgi:transcription antitermination factor NusG